MKNDFSLKILTENNVFDKRDFEIPPIDEHKLIKLTCISHSVLEYYV